MIKKRNLDPSLVSWIMHQTGLGPGIGDIFYVADTTLAFYQKLLDDGHVAEADIFTLASDAHNACTATRNDVVLLTPGIYTETAELAWSKDWTHMIGLGGPNSFGDYSLRGCIVDCNTAAVAETIDCTGDRCQFQNVLISNRNNNAGNLAAFNLDGWGCYFKRVTFHGTVGGTQANTEAASDLYIDRLGHFPLFEDCVIGNNAWASRTLTAAGGALRFVGTTEPRPQNGVFRRCRFLTKHLTAAYGHAVVIPGNHAIGWQWIFHGCDFHNYYENNATAMNFVFSAGGMDTHSILLRDCSMQGWTEWQHADLGSAWFGTVDCNADTGGGIVVSPSGGA